VKAILDANVLFSITLTDALLWLARHRLLVPLWTEDILEEAERSVLTKRSTESETRATRVRGRFQAMRDYFPRALVARQKYAHLIGEMRNNQEDRHVLAAAVAARADIIVTANVKHFQPESLIGLPVGGVMTPDAFMCELHRSHPLLVEAVADIMLAEKEHPRMSIPDLADRLVAAGAPGFAERLGLLVPVFLDR
jgi:predicted nucleic acid-binding protein